MLQALPPGTFEAYPVSSLANKRGAEGADCIKPLSLSAPQPLSPEEPED